MQPGIKILFWGLVIFIISCSPIRFHGLIKIAENNGEFYGPAEPSISVSQKNPNIVVGGSIIDRVHYSTDGGNTFLHTNLKSPELGLSLIHI